MSGFSRTSMIILFLGAPGVGKGTFASIITQKMKPTWKTFSLGDAMRQGLGVFAFGSKNCEDDVAWRTCQ